eukprot:COSAG02_NODE_1668_length_11402_cov_21.101743_4_plen_64_part_00
MTRTAVEGTRSAPRALAMVLVELRSFGKPQKLENSDQFCIFADAVNPIVPAILIDVDGQVGMC